MRTYQGKKTGKGRRDWKRPVSCVLRRQPTPAGALPHASRCLLCATHPQTQFSNARMPGYHLELLLKCRSRDCPGGPVIRSLPANAGNTSSISGLGRFHVPQSNKARAHLQPTLHNKRSHCSEQPARGN